MASSRKTRVLFFDHTSQLGGAERSLLDLLEHLDRTRFEPLLLTSPGGPLVERAGGLGIPVHLLGLDGEALALSREAWSRNPLSVLWHARGLAAAIWQAAALVRAERVDVLHTNTLKAHVLGALVALLARKPIVWHMRDLPSSRGDSRRLLKRLFRLVKPRVLAISQAVAADLPAEMAARVVYNGIDLGAFEQRRTVAPLALPVGDGPVIGVVSHLIPWKGQDVFVRAAARLAEAHPSWRFVVVGDDIFQFRGERTRLEALAAALGIGERIAFLGHREDVPGVLAQLDLFVLPSLYEPFGRVLIEAMAAGKPIVASRAGGVPEIVLDGETGLLVAPGDPQALADAVAGLLGDRATAERLSAAGRQRVEAYFSLERTVEGVARAYDAWGLA